MQTPAPADPLDRARRAHDAGDYALAQTLFRDALQGDPRNARAWYSLGVSQQGLRRHADAVGSFQQALLIDPLMADAHTQLGVSLVDLGQKEEALTSWRRSLELRPGDAPTHCHLGCLLAAMRKLDPAIEHLRQALQHQPRHVEAHHHLGLSLAWQGKRAEAIALFRQTLELQPGHFKAWNNLGVALLEQGQKGEAVDCYRKALKVQPDYPDALFNLAVALAGEQQHDEAIAAYEKLVRLVPDHGAGLGNLGLLLLDVKRTAEALVLLNQAARLFPASADAHNNRALALMDLGRFAEAESAFLEALRLQPGHPEAHNVLGTNHAVQGRLPEALACYAHSLRLRPDYPEARWHQALTWLQTGDFERGWPEYEFRWRRKRARMHPFPQPLWDGTPFPGRTLLLHTEQGVGDIFQFIRYATLAKERGGTVVVLCPAGLERVLSTCPGVDRIVPFGPTLPPGDLQAPLMSLPMIFRTTLGTIPAPVPYLSADPARIEHWRQRLSDDDALKIGIYWQGNPKHRWDRFRSFPARRFAALAAVPGVRLYSLQKGMGAEQVAPGRLRFPLIDLGSEFVDAGGAFTDAAAVLPQMDLVIGCDSALGHLAGALGVCTWVLLSTLIDWRWLDERDDSPWYPTMRLFRQRTLNDWDEVFTNVTEEVRRLAVAPAVSGGTKTPNSEQQAALAAVEAEMRCLREAAQTCEQKGDFGPTFVELSRAYFRAEAARARLQQNCRPPAP